MSAATVLDAGSFQGKTEVPRERLSVRIARADPQKYKSVHDANAWLNPYLVMRADGIEVIAQGIASGRKTVSSNDLLRTLVELPMSAWPYGRVIAVQDTGVRAADRNGVLDRNDEEAINRNHQAGIKILLDLRVKVEAWPSA